MADEDYGDGDGADFFDDDLYLYVEDEFDVVDELAETQIPSPGYPGNNHELAMESYDYDVYEYFGELEYGGDAYWDTSIKKRDESTSDATKTNDPKKRKREATNTHHQPDKKRKVERDKVRIARLEEAVPDNVIFRQAKTTPHRPPAPGRSSQFALFPDWKERFPYDAGVTWSVKMPEDMKKAAESKDEDRDPEAGEDTEAEDVEDADTNPEDMVGDAHDLLASLDADSLRAILKEKLGSTGLSEDAFMDTITKMLSGGGSADDAAGELAKALLGDSGDDNAAALDWLQGQGVDMDSEADGNDNSVKDKRVDSPAGLAKAQDEASEKPSRTTRKRKGRADPVGNEEPNDALPQKPLARRTRSKKAKVEK